MELSGTEFMDGSAMGKLLRDYADKTAGVSLVSGKDGVMEILRSANFDELFKIA